MLRRFNKKKTSYDTDGKAFYFDEISLGDTTLYTSDVDRMVGREIPAMPLFDMFGEQSVIKAEFAPATNTCRLSVFRADAYAHSGGAGKYVFTYGDLKRVMDGHRDGKCVDAVLCASYGDNGLTLEPYVYEWNRLAGKLMRAFVVMIIAAITMYAVQDSEIRHYVVFCLLMCKELIIHAVATLLV